MASSSVPVSVGYHSGHILVGEGKHLGQQVVLIEVFEVVDLVESTVVIRGDLLDLIQYSLVVDVACPEQTVVVDIVLERRWLVDNLLEVG